MNSIQKKQLLHLLKELGQLIQQDAQAKEDEEFGEQQQKDNKEKSALLFFEPPQIISTIDISNIQDMLSSNLLAVKQTHRAVQDCQLPDIKKQLKEAYQMHLKHFDILLDFLEENKERVK